MNWQNNVLKDLDSTEVAFSVQCNPGDIKKCIPTSNTNLKIVAQNIRSIYCNFDDFILTLTEMDLEIDILILTECWLNPNKPIPQLNAYNTQASSYNQNQNDGVVVYTKNNLKAKIEEIKIEHATCLQLKMNNTVILGIYRSPSNLNAAYFINSLNSHLGTLQSYKNIIIVGDININLNPRPQEPIQENLNRQHYLNMLSIHGILPGHVMPTREARCIDHIMLKIEHQKTIAYTAIINTSITDHLTTILALTNEITYTIVAKKYITINYEDAVKKLSEKNLELLLLSNDPNHVIHELTIKINQSLEESKTIKTTPRSKRNIKPWITTGVLRCIRNRNKLQLESRLEPHNEVLKITYKRYRNFCNGLIKKLKRKYEREQIENSAKDSKALWKTIKKITHYKTNKTTNTDLLNIKTSQAESINYVNDYFANIGRKLAEDVLKDKPGNGFIEDPPDRAASSFVLFDTDAKEVREVVMGLRSDSAPGWDGIPTKFLKLAVTDVAPVVSHLANLCFNTGIFPALLKQSIVTPVYKSGERVDANNYRPISVISAISKVVEKLINKRLISYLNKFNILSENQFGFRQNRSTEDAILTLTDLITNKLDSGKKCMAVFLDLKKAFDTVSLPTYTQVGAYRH